VVLTSNNYRDMSDALKRRCIHLYIDYPEKELEQRIVRTRLPDIQEHLLEQIVQAVCRIRELDLRKRPCISETLDWARSLIALGIEDLSPKVVADTLNLLVKYRSDSERVMEKLTTSVSGRACWAWSWISYRACAPPTYGSPPPRSWTACSN